MALSWNLWRGRGEMAVALPFRPSGSLVPRCAFAPIVRIGLPPPTLLPSFTEDLLPSWLGIFVPLPLALNQKLRLKGKRTM